MILPTQGMTKIICYGGIMTKVSLHSNSGKTVLKTLENDKNTTVDSQKVV